MKKIYFCLILACLLLATGIGWSAGTCNSTGCTGTNPWTADSASYADVNYCVNTCATYGDTVNVPADTKTWATELSIAKNINLIGAGIDVTNITSEQATIIHYTPDATARTNGGIFEIAGFTIDANGHTATGIALSNATSTEVSNIKIHSNKLKNFYPTGTAIVVQGSLFGAAYLNTFDRVGIVLRVLGAATSSDGLVQWEGLSQEYGVVKNFFFEDNSITFSSPVEGYAGWMEIGRGGKGVVRYNSWSNTTDENWDVHGLQSPADPDHPDVADCEQYATIIAEFYGNKITGAANKRWMYHRGSWLLMYFNSWAGTTGTSITYGQYACDSCAQDGYGTGQHINNTYLWSNISQGITDVSMTKTLDSCGDNLAPEDPNYYLITANRDYYNYAALVGGAQTTGVGCGAARPANCTTGVGYWETAQSCSDMTDYIGSSPTTPISGTLYKCTALNTWTSYYTPYYYPHPLRDSTAPTLTSATISANGLSLTLLFSEAVNATINTGWTITPTGGAATLAYASGTGTTSLVYTVNRAINHASVETATVAYTQPTNGIEDLSGNDLATIASAAVTNNSTVETVAPTISAFVIPGTAATTSVPVTTHTCADAGVGLNALPYCTTIVNSSAGCSWTAAKTYVSCATTGACTGYGWCRDANGNVSAQTSTHGIDHSDTVITLTTGGIITGGSGVITLGGSGVISF